MSWKTKEALTVSLAALAATLLVCKTGAQEPVTPVQPQNPATAPSAAPSDKQKEKSDPDSYEAIVNRMTATSKAITEVEARILDRTKKIQDLFDSYNKAERNLTGFNGLGRVEQMELKAELYGGERLSRKKLAEEFAVLNAAVAEWSQLKEKKREDMRLFTLRRQILELKKAKEANLVAGAKAGAAGDAAKQVDIEYYQVKKEADLRTISSYPEVYGTPELWDYLYKANRDKVQDPNMPVAAGTTLIVPQDVKKLPDFNEL